MLQGDVSIAYEGDDFEQALGLVPLGYAMVVVAINQFQESVNSETEAIIDGFATLSFIGDNSHLEIGNATPPAVHYMRPGA